MIAAVTISCKMSVLQKVPKYLEKVRMLGKAI